MPEPNIVLDCYPHEILCKIVNYAGVKNLFQLLDDSFLNLNGSVKRAVNKAIREILSYDYNNKGTIDFKSADEVKRFDNHCVNEKLDVVLNLCYCMKTARDLVELQDVLTTFQPSDKTKLQLRIDFSECCCRYVDLDDLLRCLDHLRDRIVGFELIDSHKVQGEIDLKFFSNVQALKISGVEVKGSFSNFRRLQELSFTPVIGQESLLDISHLPETLKKLYINTDRIADPSWNCTTFPSLEEISIKCFHDPTPPLVKKVLQSMTCENTHTINYSYDGCDLVDDFVSLVADVAREKGFHLKALSIEGAIEHPLCLYPSELLSLRFTENEELLSLLRLSPTLKRLSIVEDYYVDITNVLDLLPSTLEHLDLSDNDASWDDANTDFSRLQNLKSVNLRGLEIDDISNFKFPESLEALDLRKNNIRTIDGVKFPNSLKHLCLGHKLNFTGCPSSIQSLILDRCVVSNDCQFGDKLVSLKLELCELSGKLKLSNNLRSLSIVHCLNWSGNIDLPQLIEEIDMSYNDLPVVPSKIGELQNLHTLKLNHNQIRDATIRFSNTSLEVLDLSSNRIEKVCLSFPEGPTNLKQLDLCGNQLKDVTMDLLGHNGRSLHNSLYELSLSDNKLENIASLVSTLPTSIKTFWADPPEGPKILKPPC